MSMSDLMAKSASGTRPGRTLAEHTHDVVAAFTALFGTQEHPSRLCERWGKFFQFDDLSAFLRNGLAVALVHDWGKANDGFQLMLEGKAGQLIRHEHLSALLLHLPKVRQWFATRPDLDQDMIVAAVVTHHLKASYETLGNPLCETDSVMRVCWEDASFRRLLDRTATDLGLPAGIPNGVPALWSFRPQPGDFDLGSQLKELRDRLSAFGDELADEEPERCRLLWALRAGLIAADSAGSGIVREVAGENPIDSWIAESFAPEKVLDGDYIRAAVIDPRVAELKGKGRWHDWTDFQLACDHLPSRALLLAPCGSGKTLAAWRWIAARLDADPAARVIFLYPSRGTATEGFRDYISWAPESDAALMHGTSSYDLDGLFADVGDDPRGEKSFESLERLFALKSWPKRIFSATVDQFLAFLQYGYGPVCQLPLLADAVLVVDEVHSFDRRMFSALQDFLQTFAVPVLCMTATLPDERRRKLERCGLHVYPREMPAELRASAEYPRYSVRLTTQDTAKERVREALRQGKRVLWVVNKVRRAQALAREFATNSEAPELRFGSDTRVYCYHSRFKLEDRKREHEAVVEAFKRRRQVGATGVLAVTTQVCEMSLDLDADLLVTEFAPVTSLVQRMGRCCRQWPITDGRFGEVLIYPAEDDKPYKPEQLYGVRQFVDRVAALDRASQAQLEAALAAAPQPKEIAAPECQFLASGPWATAGEESFRETDEFARPAVLPEDVNEFQRLRRNRKESWRADGLVLPVPTYLARNKHKELPKYLYLAEGGHYSPALGYLDEPRSPSSWIV
jgi:CRISPR-associated endonuclease/helicase Cas3